MTVEEALARIDAARRATFRCGDCDLDHPLTEATFSARPGESSWLDGVTAGELLDTFEARIHAGEDPAEIACMVDAVVNACGA